MKQNPIIKLTDVEVRYDSKTVLEQVSLTVYEKDFLGIIGPNGGGKTTLVKTILGLKDIHSGTIQYYRNNRPVHHIGIGYLPQYNQIDKKFPISVFDVILSGLENGASIWHRVTSEQKERVAEMIQRMGLTGMEKRPIGSLSGGQAQRALLGRAIISEPDVVILDEPNTYIDKRFEAQLYELLDEINHASAIILISHDVGSVVQNVKNIACVNHTLDYHAQEEITEEWLQAKTNCPIDLLGHGDMPHRVLKQHAHR